MFAKIKTSIMCSYYRWSPVALFLEKKNSLKNEGMLTDYDQVLIQNHYRTLPTVLGKRILHNCPEHPERLNLKINWSWDFEIYNFPSGITHSKDLAKESKTRIKKKLSRMISSFLLPLWMQNATKITQILRINQINYKIITSHVSIRDQRTTK